MTAAHARERGLVDLGAEAGKSWPTIWETFGKLRPSSTERTQGSAVRLASARREHHLGRTHWKLWGNSGSKWMKHVANSAETLGKLGRTHGQDETTFMLVCAGLVEMLPSSSLHRAIRRYSISVSLS